MTKIKTFGSVAGAFAAGLICAAWFNSSPVTAQIGGTGWQVGGVSSFSQLGVAAVLINPQTGRVKVCRSTDQTIGCGASANIGN